MRDDRFEWDDDKALHNWRAHRVTFEQARAVFTDLFAYTEPDPYPDEERDDTIGAGPNGLLFEVSADHAFASSLPDGRTNVSKLSTIGQRRLVDGRWHDDRGQHPDLPLDWDPPMTDAEIANAVAADPDCRPVDKPFSEKAFGMVSKVRCGGSSG